jgi:hypothetical protein
VYDWIHAITIRDKNIMYGREQINFEILTKTPASIGKQLEAVIDIIMEAFSKIQFPLLNLFKSNTDEEVTLSLSNGILLEILKLCLRSNLLEWYQKNHFLLSKGGHSLSDLYKISPAEVNTYFKLIEEESNKLSESVENLSKPV